MSEIITIHVGGSGTKVGLSFWQSLQNQSLDNQCQNELSLSNKLFVQDINGTMKPRAIFTDCDSRSISQLNKSLFSFDTDCIRNFDSCNGLFSQGFYSIGNKMEEILVNQIRRSAEQCDLLSGFIITSSPEGGTGSAITSKVLEWIDMDYMESLAEDFKILDGPDPYHPFSLASPLSIYNTILCMNQSICYSKSNYIYENNKAYKVLTNQANLHPTFHHLNSYFGTCLKEHIMPYVSSGFLNTTQRKRHTNMIPYPRLKFMCGGLGSGIGHIKEALNVKNSFMCFNNVWEHGYIYTMSLDVRENCASQNEVFQNISEWSKASPKILATFPSPYHISLFPQSSSFPNKSTYSLSNGCHSVQWLQKKLQLFSKYWNRRAFAYHYMKAGMEQIEFEEAKSNIGDLISEYRSEVQMTGDWENWENWEE